MLGAEVFKQDAKSAETAVTQLGTSSEASAKKVAPLGAEVDKAGKASAGAKAPVDAAGASTKKLGDESSVAAPKVKQTAAEVERLKKESDEAGQIVGAAAVGIGAAFAAMSTLAVAKFADFDQAVSQVGAATMASAEDLDALSASAVQAGVDTVFTATKAANAQTELAKAGVSVNDILGGALVGSLALASAGELEVARAAEIAATTLTVFGLKGTEAMNVADLLAAGAGKAQGSVDDLALGLEYVGPTFARLNIPLESTVGTLAMLASNGILGEKAGTGLRGVIQSLTAPTKAAATQMEDLGINVFDAQGNFIGMEGAAGQLQKGLGGLDEQTRSAAMGAIFGAESANVAGILYAQGAEGVAKWTDNVDDQGFASEQASMKLDNLSGDIEMLGGSMDAALIKSGSVANDTLRDMVQILTGLVDWYSNLDAGLQGTVFWLGTGTAAALLIGGTMLLAVPKIVAFRAAMASLNTSMKGVAVAGGAIGIAITAAVVILGALGAAQAEAKASADAYAQSLDAVTGAITEGTREAAIAALSAGKTQWWKQYDSAFTAAEKLGIGLGTMTDAALGNKKALAEVQVVLDTLGNGKYIDEAKKRGLSVEEYTEAVLIAKDAVQSESNELKNGQEIWAQEEKAREKVATSTDSVADATEGATGKTDELMAATQAATEASQEHRDEIALTNAAFIDIGGAYDSVIDKNRQAAEATADATGSSTDSWEDFYDGFSVSTEDYLSELQAQVDAQNNWESNMLLLAGKVSAGTLDELRKLGPEGAPLVADMVNMSGEELARAEGLFAEAATNATSAFANRLTDGKTVIDAASAQVGTGAASEIAAKLAAGTSTVEQIIVDYGLKIEGLSPEVTVRVNTAIATAKLNAFLALYNSAPTSLRVGPGVMSAPSGPYAIREADGGVVSFFANGSSGRSEHHVAQIAAAGTMRVWAEPETGGEAYIPLAPAKRGRSTAILDDVAGQFGYQLVPYGAQGYADGASDTSSRAAGTSQRSMTGMRLEGTLDLGNGLTGMMRAVVTDVLDREEDTRNAGYREGF